MPQKAGPPHNSLLELDYNPLNPSKSGREFFNKQAEYITKGEAIWSLKSLIKYVNNLPNKDDYPKTRRGLRRDLMLLTKYSKGMSALLSEPQWKSPYSDRIVKSQRKKPTKPRFEEKGRPWGRRDGRFSDPPSDLIGNWRKG